MYTISQAAAGSSLTAKAIRFYEDRHLIDPARTETGYRLYTEQDIAELRFVHHARALGLPLRDIKTILEQRREGTPPCTLVTEVLDTRIAEVDHEIERLQAIRARLSHARETARTPGRGENPSAAVCPIIENPAA
jgi:DNA-binding transcriptional MerR regulator